MLLGARTGDTVVIDRLSAWLVCVYASQPDLTLKAGIQPESTRA